MIKNCCICGCALAEDRIEALEFLGTPENQWACVPHSQVRKVQGLFLGEAGTSTLLRVSGLGVNGIEKTEYKEPVEA
jgi:hypothetical protein